MTVNVLSLAAGVQSSTVFLMALAGELPPFDHVIFADTGWEPVEVYAHLEALQAEARRRGAPAIRVVTVGNIRADHLAPRDSLLIRNPVKYPEYAGKQRTFIPFYLTSETGEGRTYRTCTKTYKIEPVEQEVRRILGLKPRQPWPTERVVTQAMGISLDEVTRMRDSRRAAIELTYPLIDRRMTRSDCHAWLAANGWSAPRSACIGCPFHRNNEWRRMRDHDPEAWADAVEFDAEFRRRQQAGLTPLSGTPYLHDSRVPLDEADLEAEVDDGQLTLFGAECEGMCGT